MYSGRVTKYHLEGNICVIDEMVLKSIGAQVGRGIDRHTFVPQYENFVQTLRGEETVCKVCGQREIDHIFVEDREPRGVIMNDLIEPPKNEKWVDKPDSPGWWWQKYKGKIIGCLKIVKSPYSDSKCLMVELYDELEDLKFLDGFGGKWQKAAQPKCKEE